MSDSDNAVHHRQRGTRRPTTQTLSRYDLLLAFIPAAFLVSLLAGFLLSIQTQTALAGAAVVGVITLVDALFLNPPIRPDGS